MYVSYIFDNTLHSTGQFKCVNVMQPYILQLSIGFDSQICSWVNTWSVSYIKQNAVHSLNLCRSMRSWFIDPILMTQISWPTTSQYSYNLLFIVFQAVILILIIGFFYWIEYFEINVNSGHCSCCYLKSGASIKFHVFVDSNNMILYM